MTESPLVRIALPCEWVEQRNKVDGGFAVKGMRAKMVIHGVNECSCDGVYIHTTGAFHPHEPRKCEEVDRTEERDGIAQTVMEYVWNIPFGEEHSMTAEDYEILFQCFMMVFSGGDIDLTLQHCGEEPSVTDLKMLEVARQQAKRVKFLGASDKFVYARPKMVVWRDSVASA